MNPQTKKKPSFVVIVFVCALCLIVVFLLNIWITNSIKKTKEPSAYIPAFQQQESHSQQDKAKKSIVPSEGDLKAEVIRKTRLQRGGDYTETIFYREGKQIARQKITADGRYEQSGKIPDGELKFFNEYNNTYGEEDYRWGKRHGLSKTYYSNGQLKEESYYQLGKLLTKKEYYKDRTLRFEVDYQDARNYRGDKEVGIGKLYYKDGTLKYEWHLTNSDKTGFKKSYNPDGTLRALTYYDAMGRIINNK